MSVDTRRAGSAGTVGDRYRLLECVAGDPEGPAVAWRAWDDVLNRPVTLTVVRPGGPAADGFLAHAHAVSGVAHPSLARVWDAVDEGDRAYVVSEWVTGTPFTALLRDGALDAESAAGTVARVADGVAAAPWRRRRVRRRAPRPRGRHRHRRGQAGPGRRRRPGRGHRRRARPRCAALRRAHGALAARPDRRRGGAAAGHDQQRAPAVAAPGPGRRARGPVQPGRPRARPGIAQRGALGRRDGQRARRPGRHGGRPTTCSASTTMARTSSARAGSRSPCRSAPAWSCSRCSAGWSAPRSVGCPASATTTTAPRTPAPRPAAHRPRRHWSRSRPPTPGCTTRTATARKPGTSPTPATGTRTPSWRTAHYRRSADFGGLKPGIGIEYDFGKATTLRQIAVSTDQPGHPGADPRRQRPGRGRPGRLPGGQPDQDDVAPPTRSRSRRVRRPAIYVVWLTQLVQDGPDQFQGSISEVAFKR